MQFCCCFLLKLGEFFPIAAFLLKLRSQFNKFFPIAGCGRQLLFGVF